VNSQTRKTFLGTLLFGAMTMSPTISMATTASRPVTTAAAVDTPHAPASTAPSGSTDVTATGRSTPSLGFSPFAQKGRFGVGLVAGSPASGLSARYYLTDRIAAQVLLGKLSGYNGFSVGGNVLYEMPMLWQNADAVLTWNVGAGANWGKYEYYGYDIRVGFVSGNIGLGLELKRRPVEVILSLRPGYLFAEADLVGSIGGASMGGEFGVWYFF